MKNTIRLLGIVALVVVIGLSMMVCDNSNGGGEDDDSSTGKDTIYTVTYNGNGNTGGTVPVDDNSPYKNGATVTVLGNAENLVKTNNTFAGWNTAVNGNGTVYTAGSTFTISTNTTLYAQWIPTLTVTFDSMGGTNIAQITSITSGNKIAKPEDPTRETDGYYSFGGWYKEGELTHIWTFESDTVTVNTTLYAKWMPLKIIGNPGPGGGTIFYVSVAGFTMTDTGETCHYLEVAPNDMPTTLSWQSAQNNISDTEDGIGTGRKNTALIHVHTDSTPAASACIAPYNAGGSKTDWFLPSHGELETLYNCKGTIDIGGTTIDIGGKLGIYYWSSFQLDRDSATGIEYSKGVPVSGPKSIALSVRAIRAF